MQFATRYHHINSPVFQGILECLINREFDQFVYRFNLFKFKESNPELNNYISTNLLENSTRLDVLKRVSNELVSTTHLKYFEIEDLLPELKTYVLEITEKDPSILYQYNFSQKIDVILSSKQLYRVYNDLFSFYQHYITYENIFKISLLNVNEDKNILKSDQKLTTIAASRSIESNDKAPGVNPEEGSECLTVDLKNKESKIDTPKEIKEFDNQLNNILSGFIINNDKLIIRYLYNFTINYYQFISVKMITFNTIDDKNIIKIPNIFPDSLMYSNNYFIYFCQYIHNQDINTVKHLINKILNYLINIKHEEKEDIICIMSLHFLLFCYIIRLAIETHPDIIINKMNTILSDAILQSKLINNFINTNFKNINIVIDIYNINWDEFNNQGYQLSDDTINEIKEQYSYLINISEDKFIEELLKFADIPKKEINSNIVLNEKHILDFKQILRNQTNINIITDLVQFLNTPQENKDITYNLKNKYIIDKERKIITTNLYNYYLSYLKNNSNIILMKKENVNNSFNSTIINLFPFISTILNETYFNSDNISTLEYYNIINSNLSDKNIFNSDILISIIFDIIIPYYINTYKKYSFENYF